MDYEVDPNDDYKRYNDGQMRFLHAVRAFRKKKFQEQKRKEQLAERSRRRNRD